MFIKSFKDIFWKPKNKRYFCSQLDFKMFKIYYKVVQNMATFHKAPFKA